VNSFLPGARTHSDPVGDGVADQVIERSAWPIRSEPGVLHVALDEGALLQRSAYALSDLLHKYSQLHARGRGYMAEDRLIARHVHAIEKDHVEVHVQVQCQSEALDQRNGTGGSRGAGKVRRLQ
jgi:hypothetical protein